jgi:hypothetical protein
MLDSGVDGPQAQESEQGEPVSRTSGLSRGPTRCPRSKPVGYLDTLVLRRNTRVVLTHWGGVQKETRAHRR